MSPIHIPIHYPNHKFIVGAAKIIRTTRIVRLASIAFMATTIWNLLWVFTSLNLGSGGQIALTVLFVTATLMVCLYGIINVINTWHFRVATPKLFTAGNKPTIAIIIPVYGEAIAIVKNTVKSVLLQEWPASRMIIVVTDDGRSDELKAAIETMAERSAAKLLYFRPPKKDDPARKGEAKAGNLNGAVEFVIGEYPYVQYIETRDADDLVGNKNFISHCIEYLEAYPYTSFVQTIKQCRVSDGDPFCNNESLFYQRSMPARFASNAVFPCGSGLVWRLRELQRIDGFPSWNLVEDLHSGYEILRRGGEGAFLPIVGAVGQIAPEDIPNFYKQRGTWALDTLRLFYYRNPLLTKGLTVMQRLQFMEIQFSYLLSFAIAIFLFEMVIGLNLGVTPIVSSGTNFFLHLLLLAVALEVHMVARARGISYREQWTARQTWLGLMPVFMASSIRALWYGPHRKPSYKVTRKYHKVGWYWRETMVQAGIILVLILSVLHSLIDPQTELWRNLGLQFWSVFFVYGFSRVVINSWHNYKPTLRKPSLDSAQATSI